MRSFRIRCNQFLEETREESIVTACRKALRKYVQLNRIVVPVCNDLQMVRKSVAPDAAMSLEFLVIDRSNVQTCVPLYATRSRGLKGEINVSSGYHGYAVVSAGKIVGDVWCATARDGVQGAVHPDLEWLGIKCCGDEAYMFDMYVVPEFRGNASTRYLLGSALVHLKESGYGRVYGFYEADNLPALWTHRVFGYRELAKRKITRMPFYLKNEVVSPSTNERAVSACDSALARGTNKKRSMNACMLAYTFYEMDNRVRRYAECLVKRGDHVDVIALRREGQAPYEVLNGVNVYRIQKRVVNEKGKLTYLLRLMLFLVKSSISLTAKHVRSRYDLIHVHSVPDFEVFATLIPKLTGAKIVLDIHDIVPEFYASKFNVNTESLVFKLLVLAERMSTAFANHVIIANHIWEKRLLDRSVSKNKSSVFLNYPDQAIFHNWTSTKDQNKLVILYPGSLSWHQGLDIAISALARIKEQVSNVELHIYGDGGEKKNLQRLIQELGLEDLVILKDSVPLEKIALVMSNADIGIVPKRNDSFGGDAFSTKILEFMSLGIPVIVARTRVDSYYFNDTIIRFFTPEDTNDLANALLLLIKDRELRERLAANALVFVKGYAWEQKKTDYFSLVDSLTGNRQG